MSRSAREPNGGISPVAWCATVLFGLVLVSWSILTPAYRTPDEPQHVNSVLRIYEGGGWPPAGSAQMSESVLRSRTLIGYTESDGHRGRWGGGTLLPGLEGNPKYSPESYPYYSDQEPTSAAERLPFDQLRALGLDERPYLDQMSQHPPLYYAVQAGILHLIGAADLRFDEELAVMRWISALMVVWLPLCGYLATRRLTGSRQVGNLAALVPLGIPQLAHIGASVTNDALVIGLGGLLTVLLAHVLTADGAPGGTTPLRPARMYRLLAAIGVVLGLVCFTKGVLLSAIPVTAVAVFVGVRRWAGTGHWWPPALWTGGVLGLAFVAGGWWYAVNLVRYGTVQPDAFGIDQRTPSREPSGWWDFTTTFVHDVSASFWGWFGWQELPTSVVLTGALTAALAVVCLAGVIGRGRSGPLILLAFPALTVGALFLTTHAMHLHTATFPGLQGRYLYGGVAALAVVAAVGIGGLARLARFPVRWLVPVMALGALAVQGYGVLTAFRGFYLAPGWTVGQAWQRMIDWSPWTEPLVAAIALATLVGGAVLVGACVWATRHGRVLPRPPRFLDPPVPGPDREKPAPV